MAKKKENTKNNKVMDSGVLTTVIVTIGTIVTAYFGYLAATKDSTPPPAAQPTVAISVPTETAPPPTAVPTDTVPPGEPTSTPVPPTDTPEPTPVPLSAGEDWLSGCISTVWTVFPTSASFSSNNGCYGEPLAGVFTARDNQLEMFVDKSVSSTENVGVFVEIPSDSIVNLSLHLEFIETGEIWVGVFSEADIQSSGYLVVIPAGNANNTAFAAYEMPGKDRFYLSSKFNKNLGNYEIEFDVSPINVFARFEKYTKTNSVPVPSEKKYLFIGYEAIVGKSNRLVADFFDLVITPR
ncbi:MAG TPA: hypothetical protein VLA72_00945 [Anaerolineales bacterium]|nr:hypothetical protein [Anaerolineales bacterium]